jgi:hypothetical protein
MGKKTSAAILYPVLCGIGVSAAFDAIERAKAKQTVEIVRRACFMAREIFAAFMRKKRMWFTPVSEFFIHLNLSALSRFFA